MGTHPVPRASNSLAEAGELPSGLKQRPALRMSS
eukprot:CAMPEP_0172039168 /NCGR_PEP_ID=MMETSP1041-20130122/23745_1 /TAXON_ID=464988 /ORGANISM="Hemiselmis andersenii, Strain CCMP439" /LENGTH=33 /DNA_ID= /DNA_START= /DNA_END= /DNA_ORIENTATION=